MSIRLGLLPGLLLLLLSAGCATTPAANVFQPGCRMLPIAPLFIDARVGDAELRQDRAGCYFQGTASSRRVAEAQKQLLVALATSRCGETTALDTPAPLPEQSATSRAVPMRLSLVQASSDGRCRFDSTAEPDLAGDDYLVERVATPAPHYPPSAYRSGREGRTGVLILIDDGGQTIGAVVESSSGHEDLDEAALTAARNWRFKRSSLRSGTVVGRTSMDFSLN